MLLQYIFDVPIFPAFALEFLPLENAALLVIEDTEADGFVWGEQASEYVGL
jgi:hypothetical protein